MQKIILGVVLKRPRQDLDLLPQGKYQVPFKKLIAFKISWKRRHLPYDTSEPCVPFEIIQLLSETFVSTITNKKIIGVGNLK